VSIAEAEILALLHSVTVYGGPKRIPYQEERYMADKTDIADLLPILERLCTEHRAMNLLGTEQVSNWHAAVSRLCRLPKPIRDVQEQFRGVHDSLISTAPDAQLIPKLINALNKTGL
jgi:hypothetical protein